MRVCKEAIILVGGKGTRLRSVVSDVPKPMAPVAGLPFLHHVLAQLEALGFEHVILAAGYLADVVRDGIGSSFGSLQVSYSIEEVPLGTGGAITKAMSCLKGEDVFVLNGDTYLDFNPETLQRASVSLETPLSMALFNVDEAQRYGKVSFENGRVTGFKEKSDEGPGLINAGLYYLAPGALTGVPLGSYSFEQAFLTPMVERGKVAGVEFRGLFIDIGIPADFMRAQELFAQ